MDCIIDGNQGIYIPQEFVTRYRDSIIEPNKELQEAMDDVEEGPDNEWYWESWNDIIEHAVLLGTDGKKYTLYQDDSLYLVGEDEVWDENGQEYVRYDD